MQTSDEPLIYTTKGNLPVKDLEYVTGWEDNEQCLIFHEVYKLNGEVVKQGAHVYMKQGLSLEAQTEKF